MTSLKCLGSVLEVSRKYRRQEAGEDDELVVLVAVDQSAEPDPAQHDGELEARAGEVDLHPCSARHSQPVRRGVAKPSPCPALPLPSLPLPLAGLAPAVHQPSPREG